jgi:hypothetical protein
MGGIKLIEAREIYREWALDQRYKPLGVETDGI